MTTALHTWLNHAQETTRIDSVTAKYGLVVDTPGTSQAGQNALRFLRSLSEHSPTFFDSQARLLSPPTPDLIPDLPASPLATPMSMSWGGPQRTARRPGRMPRSPYAPDSDALFAFEMPAEEPTYVSNHPAARRAAGSRARPYPACRAYTSPTPAHVDLSRSPPPLGSGYFPPAPEPSPAFDMFPQQQPQRQQSWDNGYPGAIPTPTINTQAHSYPTYLPSPSASSYTSTQSYPFQQSQFSPITQQQQQYQEPELDMDHCGDDADRERMSALMYGSMRARTVVAASEADPQGW